MWAFSLISAQKHCHFFFFFKYTQVYVNLTFRFDQCFIIFQVTKWPINPSGLLHDREWMVVTERGIALTQKRLPQLCFIQPDINLANNTLTLHYPGSNIIDFLCGCIFINWRYGVWPGYNRINSYYFFNILKFT